MERFPSILNTEWIRHAYFLAHWLAMSHACYNPIIYCWMNSRFRMSFKYVLRWLPCIDGDQSIVDYSLPSTACAGRSAGITLRGIN